LLGDEEGQMGASDESKKPSQHEDLEDANVNSTRDDAKSPVAERVPDDDLSKEATPEVRTPHLEPVERLDEPSEMTTPLATDDEEERTLAAGAGKGNDTK
jgi:hypothetical protein